MKIKKFTKYLKEGMDYSSYTKSLDKKEFLKLYSENCKDFNPRNYKIERGQKTESNIMYVDASKHIVDVSKFLVPELKLFFNITDVSERWKGYPLKSGSLDISCARFSNFSLYGNIYVVIPYDNAEFMITDTLTGNHLKMLDKLFPYPDENLTTKFCERVIYEYEEFTKKDFDYENAIECLNELDGNITGSIKREMEKRNMNLVELLDYVFNPTENFTLCSYKDICNPEFIQRISSRDGYFYGWTQSKVILVKRPYFNEIKNDLCVIYDKAHKKI